MDRFYEIGRTLENHHVSRLCHITQIDKLFSILYGDEGILATDFCDSKSMYYNAGSDSLEDDDLDSCGLDRDDLGMMDEEERRTTLEDVGLDPDDYDNF